MPDNVSVPPLMPRLPFVPLNTPLKVLLALVSVKALLPKVVLPAPDKFLMVAPLVVLEISNVPALFTPLLLAIEPDPVKAKVEPAPIVVEPV